MRKIVAGFAASIDGYIEGPNGEYDWILIDKEIDFNQQMKRFDTFLFGRKTYEKMLPSGTRPARGITNYVFSNSLAFVDPNYILVKGNIKEELLDVKQQEGKDIALFGGASLLASLLDLHLVDELSISFIPVMLGMGKHMVGELTDRVRLSLLNTKTYANGTVLMTFQL
jgi:dihydrofolate reductase